MFYFLSIFWFIREIKAILFWLYLWQLKEYHLGRFFDHFRTYKGKKLLLNKLLIFKIILLLIFIFVIPWRSLLFYLIFFLYFFEATKGFFDFFQKKLIKPVFTKKIIFLTFIAFTLTIFYLFVFFQKEMSFLFWLLLFDILTPVIVSGIILCFQPLTILLRNQIIKKAKEKREKFKDLLVIGITGSYGKTSTKEFLATILSEKFGKNKVLKTKEHQNSEIGISQCILQELKPEHQIFVCEMGAYNRGGIKLLCDITKPKIGIITGVNEQHLATFGSMENLLSAEGGQELIDSLPSNGTAFFNAKNKYCQELYQKTKIKKFLYGQNVELRGFENIEGAKIVAQELGMTEQEINRGAEKIENKFPGIQIKNINGLNIIDATYSANPDGVMAHLEYLKTFPGRKIIVMPCLIELGKASKEVHKKIGKKIAEVCDLAIITTKDRFKEIKKEAPNVLFIENPKKIIEKIKSFCKEGNVVLLEGRIPKEIVESLDSLILMNFLKPISISLSPNTEKDDILLALKLLFQPWKWKKDNLINYPGGEKFKFLSQLEEKFKNYFGLKYAISFNSGRSALMAILNSLGLEKDDEVLIQAFTCNAAVNPILWSGLKPIYIDCDEKTFNIDIEDLKRKITKKSRVVMVQHTFGLPADLNEILEICQKNNLILIEDCAHSLGAEYKNKKVGLPTEALAKAGTFGKAGFFSFSRDKVISSVYGGMAITNDDELGKKIREYQEKIDYPCYFWILQQLLHPILMNWLILPTYRFFGKYLLILFQLVQILSKAVHWKEKRGKKPSYFPKRMPNALAILALNQFQKLERFNNHRKEITDFYRRELKDTAFELPLDSEQIYLRFTIKHPKAHDIIKKAWQKNLLIGDWYTSPVAPDDTKLKKMQYFPGTCPKAEKLSKQTFNLPTHINISQKDAQKITNFLKTLMKFSNL